MSPSMLLTFLPMVSRAACSWVLLRFAHLALVVGVDVSSLLSYLWSFRRCLTSGDLYYPTAARDDRQEHMEPARPSYRFTLRPSRIVSFCSLLVAGKDSPRIRFPLLSMYLGCGYGRMEFSDSQHIHCCVIIRPFYQGRGKVNGVHA